MNFSTMVTQSVFVRLLATVLLFVVALLAVCIAAYDLIIGATIPQVIVTIIGVAIGYGCSILGVNLGINLQPMPTMKFDPVTKRIQAVDPEETT